ncbi:SgrR family transcriptional regulator [Listeria innocua]|uniref:ABC transporter substrate-binding protein n=1 Tax=Listeria innocua TaxID=1642 RepID=UPI001888E027|nr:ABC transporter substrate-binding protein [Listeria innocua]MBF2443794.1 SgrR family transcriptional regulator [Listeria innocua]MBF2662301.1 SgrR family transcriptional regulator [Listeria innocua]
MRDPNYFELRSILHENEKENIVHFSLGKLAEAWYYSKKNAKKKLQKYEENNLIKYIPGNGRGNLSTIIFHNDFYSEVHEVLTNCIENKDIKFALQLSQLSIPQEWFTPFLEEIHALFNHGSENGNNVLRFVINRKIEVLDPNLVSLHFEASLIKQISNTLVDYNEEEDTFTSSVAIDWSHTEDFTKWTFNIRRNIFFHNEKKVTGSDVLFTFKEAAKSSTGKWLLSNLEKAYSESENIVHFIFRKPEPSFLKLVTHYSLVIRPANSNSKKLIGCGPFMLVESKNNYVYLKSFSKYFKEHPLIDGVEFWLINSNFKKWLIVPQEKYIQLNNDGVKPIEVARSGVAYLIFNKNKQNPTDMLLINYLKLIFNVADFVSELYQASIPAAYSYFYELSKSLEPVQNKQLVTPSDVSSYIDKPLNLAVFNHPRLIQEALWFKERAAMFKLKIEIITYTFDDDFFKEKILVDADIALAMDVPVTDVELGYLDFLLNKTLLFQRFINTEQTTTIVSLTEEYRAAVSFEQKTTLINQIEDYIKRENILIYLYHPLKHYNIHTFINGVEFDSNGNIALGKLWW